MYIVDIWDLVYIMDVVDVAHIVYMVYIVDVAYIVYIVDDMDIVDNFWGAGPRYAVLRERYAGAPEYMCIFSVSRIFSILWVFWMICILCILWLLGVFVDIVHIFDTVNNVDYGYL